MSLKSYFQLLLDTYHTSHKSVPFYANSIYETGLFTSTVANEVFLRYTAPSDGLLVLQVTQGDGVSFSVLTMRRGSVDIAQGCLSGWGWPLVQAPVKKGEEYTFLYKISGGNGAQERYYLYFFPYLN